jgi:hypothetical protein
MRHLSIRVVVILATISAMLFAVRLAANGSPSLAVNMLQAQQCDPQPCWQGVRPNAMTRQRAEDILKAQGALPDRFVPGDTQYCWSSMTTPFWRSCAYMHNSAPESTIQRINVEFLANPPRLGDAVLMFGQPVSTGFCHVTNGRRSDLPERFLSAFLMFRGDIFVMAYKANDLGEQRLDPNMMLLRMAYVTADTSEPSHWRGFTHLVPENESCYIPR